MTSQDEVWDEMFARLLSFHEEFGHDLVPADWDDRKLAVYRLALFPWIRPALIPGFRS